MKTVAIVVTARPSYARLKTLILALQPLVQVQVLIAGSALLDRYGSVAEVIERDCGPAAWKGWTVIEGETLETAARSTGLLLTDLSAAFRLLRPDAVVVHGDRHEVLAAAMAARYQEIPLIHLQGGEQTGSVDDRVRDAITQLADYHLVSTERAAGRVWAMRGHTAVVTGCPSLDLAAQARQAAPVTLSELGGSGADVDLSQPFLVVLQHPTTDHVHEAYTEMARTLVACSLAGLPVVVFWPGNEAGMAATSKAIRVHRDGAMRTVRNLPPERFLRLLTQAACLVGNSSVGIREASFLGVPVVNLGDRQQHRERGGNVLDSGDFLHDIADAIRAQVAHGPYPASTLYGDGNSGPRMAAWIADMVTGDTCSSENSRRITAGTLTLRVG